MAKLKTVSLPTTNGLAAFKAANDPKVIIPNKVRAALDKMAKANPESWAAEEDLLAAAGVTKEEIRGHREAFDDHIVEVKKKGRSTPARFWFADVKVAAKARS